MDDPSSSSNPPPSGGYLPIRSERLSYTGSQPYSKSRDSRESNHSDSVWEDALSTQSLEEMDDTLSMLAAEISSRIYPSPTSVIMEDSPEQERSVSEPRQPSLLSDQPCVDSLSVAKSSAIVSSSDPQDNCVVQPIPKVDCHVPSDQTEDSRVVADKMNSMQSVVEQQFKNISAQIADGQSKQQHMASAADTLVESLRETLQALQISQAKHEATITANEAQMQALMQSNAELVDRNLRLSQLAEQQKKSLESQEEHQRNLTQATAEIHHQQVNHQQQLGAHNQATLQMRQELNQMRLDNRQRSAVAPSENPNPLSSPMHHAPKTSTESPRVPGLQFGPKQLDPRILPQFPTAPASRPPVDSPFQVPTNAEWGFTPVPCLGFPNMVIDSCPTFTPNTFQNWKREIKLWIAGQPGASTTQLLAKLIHVLPLAVKTEALLYMDQTERRPEERSIATIINMLDARFGRTDSERACSWLTAFTEFKRETNENYKDFWARFTRCTAKLEALGMPMIEKVVFNRVIHALRLPEGQLPIVLSVLETRPDRFSVNALREVTIRMYETHKPGGDPTEVFTADAQSSSETQLTYHNTESPMDPNDWNWQWEELDWNYDGDASEILLEDGSIMLMKPKKPTKPRNTPGIHEASRRGAVKAFSYIPNRKGKGKTVCLRCGDPSHHWKDCPHPFREKLDPRFSSKGKGKAYMLTDETGESQSTPPAIEAPPVTEPATTECNPAGGIQPTITEPVGQPIHQASINDVWAQYYTQPESNSPAFINVCYQIHFHQPKPCSRTADIPVVETTSKVPPPILIDSGASCSVVGEQWLLSWGKDLIWPTRCANSREFRFGDGPPVPSLGELNLPILIPAERTNDGKSHVLTFRVDVVAAVVPLLISQQALTNMQGRMDFLRFTLEIPNRCTIWLIKSPTGHVLLPGIISADLLLTPHQEQIQVFPMQQTGDGKRTLRDEQVQKIHQQLGHCSEKQLLDLLKFGGCKADTKQVSRITQRCGCQRSVHRITPPVVSSWIARFSGEIVAIDVIFPFTDLGPDGLFPKWKATGRIPALLVVDSLTRFVTCQIVKDVNSERLTNAFMNDWVKHFGKPKRIILDQGSPGLFGGEWENLSHVFGWQYIRAPSRAPHQNGLAERTVRSLKAAIQSIVANDSHSQPSQALLTLAVIAKNHAPHSITGLPPAFAMTGRCDVASGASTCMWEHDPLSHDSLIPQMNSLRKIIEARDAVIAADSSHAIASCLNHQLIDRGQEYFPIGSSVQIAVDKKWTGTFRVIAHSAGNILVERGNKILKWPKCKSRLVNQENHDEMDNIPISLNAKAWNKRKEWLQEEFPEEYQPTHSQEPEAHADSGEVVDVQDSPLSEQQLMDMGQQILESPEQDGYGDDDTMDIGMIIDTHQPGHQWPHSTYVNYGSLICERLPDISAGSQLDATHSTYYHMGPMLPKGFTFTLHAQDRTDALILATRESQKKEYLDQDILDGFGPSRIPPRIAFKLAPARAAIEREITDLLQPKAHEPPAMIEIDLRDSRYTMVPRVHSTLVVKRKGIDSYKGRLCVRGDTVPLQTTAFVSSPTAHRCAVKLICALASQLSWVIHAIDVSQAFLQSSNLNPKDRVVVIPPNMIHLPWNGKLPPMHTDIGQRQNNRGFLLLRPLYGGRDAPMRWFLALSKRLREHGFTQLKTDVCMYTKRDSHGELSGLLVAHVDDLLFCGTAQFRKDAIHAIQTFRTGEVETLTETTPIIFTGLLIEKEVSGTLLLSQQMYADELPLMHIAEYLGPHGITNPAGLKSTFKQGLGALIWLHQTRPDIGFTITQIATQIVEGCSSKEKATHVMNLYNKIVKFVKNHPRKIHYCMFPTPFRPEKTHPSSLLNWKLFVFTDAGFGTLSKNHSVESHVVILGDVISRDGVIKCHGVMLDHRCAKIHRVCRSTLAAEAHAAVTAVDVALWFQVLLIEIFTQKFDYRRLTPPTDFPLRNPFNDSPSNAEVQQETGLQPLHMIAMLDHSANPMITDAPMSFQATCHCCKIAMTLTTSSTGQLSEDDRRIYLNMLNHQAPASFHPLILTDCCSLYGAILRLQPRTIERCTRITLAFLRDALLMLAISYVDATVNLGDVGTKHAGSLGILDHYLLTGRFTLSFIGRKERR